MSARRSLTTTERRPPPPARECDVCRAWVTTAGQTHGVLCGASACPFPKLSWGEPAALIDQPDHTILHDDGEQ